ncbi:MAG: hypothetical protein QXP56_07650 [Archaeoglobaceae archaeon]
MSSSPIFATNVVVEIGTTAVSFARRFEARREREITEEKTFSGIVRGVGFTRVSFSFEYLYADNQILQLIQSGEPQTVKIYPQGKGTGKPVWTLINAVFPSDGLSAEPESFIVVSVEGVADDLVPDTQS